MSPDEQRALTPYLALLDAFASGQVPAPAFEEQYLARYKADPFLWSEPVFDVLDRLFADVDAYVADDDLRDAEDGDLDDAGLLAAARTALDRLRAL